MNGYEEAYIRAKYEEENLQNQAKYLIDNLEITAQDIIDSCNTAYNSPFSLKERQKQGVND